ncbi:MAG: calcium-binding protein, partial [Pseudomonadota bacterium]
DVFVFEDGFGNDVITDFNVRAVAEDIDLSGVSAITSFADLAANHMAQVGADVVITAGADTITVQGADLAKLDAEDFIF